MQENLFEIIGTNIDSHITKIQKHDIHYVTVGQGKPLLLLHGINFGWGQWYQNIKYLSKYYQIIAPDLPGAGLSFKVDLARLDLQKDFFEVVEAFIKKIRLKKFNIIGHSLGGWLALKLALKYPDCIEKIIIEDSVGFTRYIPFKQRIMLNKFLLFFLTKTIIHPSKREIKKFLISALYNKSNLSDDLVEYYFSAVKYHNVAHPLIFMHALAEKINDNSLDLSHQLTSIKQPTLIIAGAEDKLLPIDRTLDKFSRIPQVEIKILQNTGHVPSIEHPQIFNQLVKKFL